MSLEELTIQMLEAWRADLANKITTYDDHPNKTSKRRSNVRHTLMVMSGHAEGFSSGWKKKRYLDHNSAKRLELPPKPKGVEKGSRKIERDLIIEQAKK